MEVGRVSGEEGAEGSQFTGSSVQACQRAGPAQGWAPGNGPPQPKRLRQVLATGHGASLLSAAGQGGTGKTFGLLRQSWIRWGLPPRAQVRGKLQKRVETVRLEIPLSFL